MTDPRAVVIGAGPTGLGVGLSLALNGYGGPVTIIEQKGRSGGLAGSFDWNGHTVDFGPHRLSPAIPVVRALADELLGPDLLIKKSQHGVQFDGKLYQFPPRVVDWVAPRSLGHLMAFASSLVFEQAGWVTRRFDADTFETMLKRKFGRRFFEKVAAPMATKVWTEPQNLDPAFVAQRFASIEPFEVLKKLIFPKQDLNPSTFFYPRRGFQQLWDAMSAYLARGGQELCFDTRPVRIEVRKNRVVRIVATTAQGETAIEDPDLTLVSTIPLASLTRLLSGFEGEEELRRLSTEVHVRSMVLVALEFDQERTLPYRTLIFPERAFSFNRLFEQNEYSRDTVTAGKSVIVADITADRGAPELAQPDEVFIERVRSDLQRLPYVRTEAITAATVHRVEFAYVVPDTATRQRFHRVLHALKAISNLHVLGRFGAGEYDNSDYALDNGMTLGAMLAGRSTRAEYLTHMHAKRGRYILG